MTYANIAAITQSASLFSRLTACAAEENKTTPYSSWVSNHIWDIAATPGWAAAWGSALAAGVTDPGANEGVISDGMILAAIQPMNPEQLPA